MKTALTGTDRITKLGTARHFLEIAIDRIEDSTTCPGERRFIDPVLNRFHMGNAYKATTTINDKVRLELFDETERS